MVTPLDMELLATKIVYINSFQELEFIEEIFLKYDIYVYILLFWYSHVPGKI